MSARGECWESGWREKESLRWTELHPAEEAEGTAAVRLMYASPHLQPHLVLEGVFSKSTLGGLSGHRPLTGLAGHQMSIADRRNRRTLITAHVRPNPEGVVEGVAARHCRVVDRHTTKSAPWEGVQRVQRGIHLSIISGLSDQSKCALDLHQMSPSGELPVTPATSIAYSRDRACSWGGLSEE